MNAVEAEQEKGADASLAPPRTSFRAGRVFVVGVPLLVLQTFLIVRSSLFFGRYISASSLPQVTIGLLLVVCLLNRAAGKRWPRAALTGAELAVIFGMLLLTAAIPQAAVVENVVSVAATPAYFSNPRNGWTGLFFSRAPDWLRVTDPAVARGFFEGGARGASVPWTPWLVPLAAWGVFFALFFGAMACLGALCYRQWATRERVNFPLVILPLEIIKAGEGDPHPFWRSGLFWLGALPPAVLITLGDIHSYIPTVPEGKEIYDWPLTDVFKTPPWTALNGFDFSLWAIVVGIGYFLQSEVAVSIWAFHLLSWAQRVGMAALGIGVLAGAGGGVADPLELIRWQEFGGTTMFSLLLLGNLTKAWRRDGWPRGTVAAFAACMVGLLVWGTAAGAGPLVTGGFMLVMCLVAVTLSRLVAAGGLFLVDAGFAPQQMVLGLAGTRAVDPGGQFILAGMDTIYGRPDMNPAYFTLNSLRAADDRGAPVGLSLIALFAFSALLVYVLSCAWILSSSYQHGGALKFRAWPLTSNAVGHWNIVADAVRNPSLPRGDAVGWMAGGAVLVLALSILQTRFSGWPLSPIGLAVASSWNTTYQIWSSVLIGWLCSAAVRRWGGLQTYTRLRPFFLGLILGNMVAVMGTTLVDMALGVGR